MDRLQLLRNEMKRRNVDAFIIPSSDEFQGEYVPASFRRLEWISGFTGSAGLAIVMKDKAAFFTDGRYTLQAKAEIARGFVIFNIADLAPHAWLGEHLKSDSRVGYDAMLHTPDQMKRYKVVAEENKSRVIPSENLIDLIWKHRPKPPKSAVEVHPLKYSGQASSEKRQMIASMLKEKKIDAAIITAPDSMCWLLNIRGRDVPHNPFILAYGILENNGNVQWFIDKARVSPSVKAHLGKGVKLLPPSELEDALDGYRDCRVLIDPSQSADWFFARLRKVNAEIVEAADPCQWPKACKNIVEINGMRKAHIRDGAAEVKFLAWLDKEARKGKLTEISVADKLEAFRRESPLLKDLSFDTIAGFAANGAIVHYRASEKTNARIKGNDLLLLDSGGQYLDGTTDITRTIVIGKPSKEHKEKFTRVLKGHIALARAQFPAGTSGAQLDVLARMPLWLEGLDFDHGTGHGVGSYLSVHEGPQRISKVSHVPLTPGMVLSNEPGYYEAGNFGIRIENLVVVRKSEVKAGKTYLEFETITVVPFDRKLIEKKMLTADEIAWVNEYHAHIAKVLPKHLDAASKEWLKNATKSI